MRPLEGIKVLDLTRLLPGPYGTMLLGDLGADVVRSKNRSGATMPGGTRRRSMRSDPATSF